MSKNILVLCTGNSARSILAEAYFNHVGKDRLRAFSAGSEPTGQVNPLALAVLKENGIVPDTARSKSWNEFAADNAQRMDVVITVCDNAAKESCPVWPGAPLTLHWPFQDPAAATGTEEEKLQAFRDVFALIRNKIEAFMKTQNERTDAV